MGKKRVRDTSPVLVNNEYTEVLEQIKAGFEVQMRQLKRIERDSATIRREVMERWRGYHRKDEIHKRLGVDGFI